MSLTQLNQQISDWTDSGLQGNPDQEWDKCKQWQTWHWVNDWPLLRKLQPYHWVGVSITTKVKADPALLQCYFPLPLQKWQVHTNNDQICWFFLQTSPYFNFRATCTLFEYFDIPVIVVSRFLFWLIHQMYQCRQNVHDTNLKDIFPINTFQPMGS